MKLIKMDKLAFRYCVTITKNGKSELYMFIIPLTMFAKKYMYSHLIFPQMSNDHFQKDAFKLYYQYRTDENIMESPTHVHLI